MMNENQIVDSIMIDLETLATGPNAGLIQIGAIAFNSRTGQAKSEPFEVDVDLISALMAGGEVDGSTVRWWQDQGGPNLKRPKEVRAALHELSAWFKKYPDAKRVWAQGPSFDTAVLEGYFRRLGMKQPWSYNAARDTRTVYDLARERGWQKPEGTEPVHEGLEDCRRQVICLMSALRFLRGEAEDPAK